MARSSTGGTRGFIRGKVAQDLYQVTKDARGRKIQIVKAVEESRVNNNTMPQAMARMQMALCLGSLSTFKDIVDHSFETVPYGQLSIAHFVHINLPNIKQDCINSWAYNYLYDYPLKGVSASRPGAWIMSEGSLQLPSIISTDAIDDYGRQLFLKISPPQWPCTMRQLKDALGLNANDYITHCAFGQGVLPQHSRLVYLRVYLNPEFADDTIIDASNINRAFTYESNIDFVATVQSDPNCFVFQFPRCPHANLVSYPMNCVIISRWNGKVWQRNNARLMPAPRYEDYAADWASPWSVFDTWFPEYDPEASDEYPLPTEDWLDLGLPSGTRWRKFNVGAVEPHGVGLYFSWGNVQGHHWNGSAFDDGYSFTHQTYNQTPGSLLTSDIDKEHDAAREYLGVNWRTPSFIECEELLSYTIPSVKVIGGIRCLCLQSKVNGNALVIPFCGLASNTSIDYNNSYTWLFTNKYNSFLTFFTFRFGYDGSIIQQTPARYYGYNIRPVYVP